MSCSSSPDNPFGGQCCNDSDPACNPCSPALSNTESMASQMENLIQTLLGSFTKTIVNGRAVWSAPCNPASQGVACIPRNNGEGLICYLLRVLTNLGIFFGGTWSALIAYCPNTFVTYNGTSYVSLQSVPANTQPNTNPLYWTAVAVGPKGDQGPPGPPGAGSAPSFAIHTTTITYAPGDNDGVIFCEPAAPIAINLPSIAASLSGKYFRVWTNGAFNVTINANGADRIDAPGGLVASYVLDTANEAILLVSNNSGKWRIM